MASFGIPNPLPGRLFSPVPSPLEGEGQGEGSRQAQPQPSLPARYATLIRYLHPDPARLALFGASPPPPPIWLRFGTSALDWLCSALCPRPSDAPPEWLRLVESPPSRPHWLCSARPPPPPRGWLRSVRDPRLGFVRQNALVPSRRSERAPDIGFARSARVVGFVRQRSDPRRPPSRTGCQGAGSLQRALTVSSIWDRAAFCRSTDGGIFQSWIGPAMPGPSQEGINSWVLLCRSSDSAIRQIVLTLIPREFRLCSPYDPSTCHACRSPIVRRA
jgi:hypothetical protein